MEYSNHRFCLIVGAGPSGLIQAVEILRSGLLSLDQIEILERNERFGGTWAQNTYPGAACDIVSNIYQISYYRNPNWTRRYASQEEIAAYYAGFAKKFNLDRSTQFHQKVIKTVWSDETMLWHIIAENSITGVKSQWTANIVVNAAGLFHKSHIPNIPGISDFKGRAWHTMHWPKEADLEGKRVAVIGTGPSAGQVIPQIQPIVKSLTVYQRSTTYCLPRQDYAYSAIARFLFNYVPFVHYIYYLWLYWSFEYITFYVMRPKTFFARKAKELGQQHLESQVKDPILRKKLWPLNDFACKRPLILDDYYPALQQPNVELITDPVIQITSTGVVSKPVRSITPKDAKIVKEEAKTSDHAGNEAGLESYSAVNVDPQSTERNTEVDVIIWGTGFHVQSHGSALEAIGRSGKSLNEHWGEDPRSLFGVAASDFPNFMILFGPNASTPWGSLIYNFEMQSAYNVRVMREIKQRCLRGDTFAMMPDPVVEKEYADALQKPLSEMAMSATHGCKAYYSTSKGRNTHFFPYHQAYYKWITRKVELKNYILLEKSVGAKSPIVRRGM